VRWQSRLPFFAEILDDGRVRIDDASQPVIDQEIHYARLARLDYWAFLLYDENDAMSLGLKHYLSSTQKEGLRFCLIVEPRRWNTADVAMKELQRVAALMGRTEYQTVAGGRPLLYVLDNGPDAELPAISVDRLRALVRTKGGGDPYIVMQDWRPARANQMRIRAKADAIGSYSYQRDGRGAPFAQLARETENFWEQCRMTGSPVVPIVMTGWDRRPRVERPVFWETWQQPNAGIEKFYHAPTPAELSHHLEQALTWVRNHPDAAPSKAILIYAWNENDEGGWLVPGREEGDWRLKAVREGLRSLY
jgi:hypothetical protein